MTRAGLEPMEDPVVIEISLPYCNLSWLFLFDQQEIVIYLDFISDQPEIVIYLDFLFDQPEIVNYLDCFYFTNKKL